MVIKISAFLTILGLMSLAGAYRIIPNIEDGMVNIRNTLCSLIN